MALMRTVEIPRKPKGLSLPFLPCRMKAGTLSSCDMSVRVEGWVLGFKGLGWVLPPLDNTCNRGIYSP